MIFFKKAMYTLIENTTNTVKNTEEIKIQLRSHPQRKKKHHYHFAQCPPDSVILNFPASKRPALGQQNYS